MIMKLAQNDKKEPQDNNKGLGLTMKGLQNENEKPE
jgi:hypothetical protein